MNSSDAAGSVLDFRQPTPVDRIPEGGMLAGQVDGAPVLLLRRGALIFAIGGSCTHYGAPLAEGLLTGDTVRCPLHHACFDFRTGRLLGGPALSSLPRYQVERLLDMVVVTGKLAPEEAPRPSLPAGRRPLPARIVIVGAGAAGTAAASALRADGYQGQLTLIGAEAEPPYDRPNLSKGYLAGTASEEWLPLQPRATYDSLGIRLVLGTPVSRIDSDAHSVSLEDGRVFPFDALLLAPGATPIRPPIPGIDLPTVRTLRSRTDVDRLIELATGAQRAVVIGAGFLGLEAAAALRTRGLGVEVVTPDAVPLEAPLGEALGVRLLQLHRDHGVGFQLRRSAVGIGAGAVTLDDGTILKAELVVVATGVRPNTGLASRAGLVVARGIQVDRHLETSRRGIFAAGDAVSWPDPRSGELTGCGHWSLAMRMGETAAHNMLGAELAFEAVPFFWSEHYDLRINCSGFTERRDRIEVLSGLPDGQWEQRYWREERLVAVATINRDYACLTAEMLLERGARPSAARARLPGGIIHGAQR